MKREPNPPTLPKPTLANEQQQQQQQQQQNLWKK